MKIALLPLLTLVIFACSEQASPNKNATAPVAVPAPIETETFLVCNGVSGLHISTNLFPKNRESRYFTITKLDEKVVRVRTNDEQVFSLKETPRDPKFGDPASLQLLVESEVLILRTTFTGSNKNADIAIKKDGTYKRTGFVTESEGRCEVGQKAF